MQFIYGKQDWKTAARGEEICYLMTNGLGGFSSLSSIASCSRNDQAVLMACIHAPNYRYNMIHWLEEHLLTEGRSYPLASQRFRPAVFDWKEENGYLYQTAFTYEDYPVWEYLVPGTEIRKTIVLAQGENTVGITYEICNRTAEPVTLEVTPWLQFVPKGERMSREQKFYYEELEAAADEKTFCRIRSNKQTLYLKTNGVCREIPGEFHENLFYASDVEDGKMALGRCAANHKVSFTVEGDSTQVFRLVYGMEKDLPEAEEIRTSLCRYRKELERQSGRKDPLACQLAVSASQYISQRLSTGKKTILAGFPFFEDWGRDTMISLPGCCLTTGQFETAKEIFETFLQYCEKGVMPNLFPEGTQKPWYNTVDAALLFILAVYEYEQKTGDHAFVRQIYPVMEEIITWYQKGTDFQIHMDEDGLICAGGGYDQVTWMDVRVENILPTPRHGKPVEINAYWYNALRMMEIWQKQYGTAGEEKKNYGELAELVKESFEKKFWNEEEQCLLDVISGTKADRQIRCNQIWAVAQPFSVLPPEKEKKVVDAVFYHLYTPYGLRTLSWKDPEFHPFYGGAQLDRDLAYHQGTVWPFPLGAYYRAWLKVHQYSAEAKQAVRAQLQLLEPALREGCVGQLPEIYDGANPVLSKGCFAQAWSVGEILRVFDLLEETEDQYLLFR